MKKRYLLILFTISFLVFAEEIPKSSVPSFENLKSEIKSAGIIRPICEQAPTLLEEKKKIERENFLYALSCHMNKKFGSKKVSYSPKRERCGYEKAYPQWLWDTIAKRSVAQYRISNQADGIHLEKKIRFEFEKSVDKETYDFTFKSLKECKKEIQDLWKKNGVILDLVFDTNREKKKTPEDNVIVMTNKWGRPDSEEIFLKGDSFDMFEQIQKGMALISSPEKKMKYKEDQEKRYRDVFLCPTLNHEMGHLFGLKDEYVIPEDPSCIGRIQAQEKNPYSFMDKSDMPLTNIALLPRHIHRILFFLCK